jgi:dimethyladenosine transferase 2
MINSKPPKEPEILFPNSDMSSLPDFVAPSTTLSTSDFVQNIHVFTQFGMLTPTQILSIFNEFASWPEYESCTFVSALEKALIKMHTKEDDELSDDEGEEILLVEDSNERPKNLAEILSSLTVGEIKK